MAVWYRGNDDAESADGIVVMVVVSVSVSVLVLRVGCPSFAMLDLLVIYQHASALVKLIDDAS